MITWPEVVRSLNGVWLLFLDRKDAVRIFDASIEGFWRSFQAILIVAPIYAISSLADHEAYLATAAPGEVFDSGAFYLARALTLALDWVTLPALLAVLAPFLGIQSGYSAYVVIRNWASLFTMVPFALVSLLGLGGVVEGEWILIPAGLVLAISIRISFLAARRVLGAPVDAAIGFVALDFLVSLALARTVAYLFGTDL